MNEIYSYSVTDRKPQSPYSYLHSNVCPKCTCTEESMIVYDDDLVKTKTVFGKNKFWKKKYTLLPHKCKQCGEFFVMVGIQEEHNQDFIKSLIWCILAWITQIVLLTVGIIRAIDNKEALIISAICFILVLAGASYALFEEATRYSNDRGYDMVIDEYLNERWGRPFSAWEEFNMENETIAEKEKREEEERRRQSQEEQEKRIIQRQAVDFLL